MVKSFIVIWERPKFLCVDGFWCDFFAAFLFERTSVEICLEILFQRLIWFHICLNTIKGSRIMTALTLARLASFKLEDNIRCPIRKWSAIEVYKKVIFDLSLYWSWIAICVDFLSDLRSEFIPKVICDSNHLKLTRFSPLLIYPKADHYRMFWIADHFWN